MSPDATSLVPRLTGLDRQVLETLPSGAPGVRLQAVHRALRRRAELDEIQGILRGLEHLGHASGRNGWWSR